MPPPYDFPVEAIAFESRGFAEVVLYNAGGMWRLMPKAAIANGLEEMAAQTKKAESPKGLLPPVVLRFSQTVEINKEAAQVLLEELVDDLPNNRN